MPATELRSVLLSPENRDRILEAAAMLGRLQGQVQQMDGPMNEEAIDLAHDLCTLVFAFDAAPLYRSPSHEVDRDLHKDLEAFHAEEDANVRDHRAEQMDAPTRRDGAL